MPAGRPRAFDADKALEKAMLVFWRKGYEGASLADLTQAMGINPPSLYSCYGSKEGLFLRALDLYEKGPARYTTDALAAPTAREAVETLLRCAITLNTRAGHPHGCLLVQTALVVGDASESIRNELAARRAKGVVKLRLRFERAKDEGDLPHDADPAQLARYVAIVLRGIAVEAASGASAKDLTATATLVLANWPQSKKRTAKRVTPQRTKTRASRT